MSLLVKSVCVLFWLLCSSCLWSWYLIVGESGVGFLGLASLSVGILMLLSQIWDMLDEYE